MLMLLRTARHVDRTGQKPLTAGELAQLVGTTKAQILAYENGHQVPDPPRLRDLAEVLGVHPRSLMNREREPLWTVADLRRASALRAQDLVDSLGISPKSYRRFEREGIVPGRRPRFLDDVSLELGVRLAVLERAIDNVPQVSVRRAQAKVLIERMVERYVDQPGMWKGPAAEDHDLLELANLYGRPPQRTRRVLTHELGELRQIMVRLKREQVIAEYDRDPNRQQQAYSAVERWSYIQAREVASIPRRLEDFHRAAQPSDTWQVLVDLHDASCRPEGPWAPSILLGREGTMQLLPSSLVRQQFFTDMPAAQLTTAGLKHVQRFRELYAALYPGIRRPRNTPGRGNAAPRPMPTADFFFAIRGRPERFVLPPFYFDKLSRKAARREELELRVSPTLTVKLGPARPSATFEQEPSPSDDDHEGHPAQ
ncbi:hypothetical protein A8W25_29695 [Streptomyces sp. ERV7]|nr:hypothetical protein A8W25_29695 [Streptomyces sp. ERV7]